MKVSLIGMGAGGNTLSLTLAAQAALQNAQCILGASRLLEQLPATYSQSRVTAILPDAILQGLQCVAKVSDASCAVVFSGDSGFYSGARKLLPLLRTAGFEAEILPGVSSVQLLAAALGRPWQDWELVSAHGKECDPIAAILCGKPTFFLTGGAFGPATLCQMLADAGLAELRVTVGENLGCTDETITEGTAGEFAQKRFAPLSVLLAEPAPCPKHRTGGWPDSAFQRGEKIPMTKQIVRAAVLSKLAVQPGETVWDVGAGTGSVSVELALAAGGGRVYAIEGEPAACELIAANRTLFCAWNLVPVTGWAPTALENLPTPDAVFIGGSKGNLRKIMDTVFAKNPAARICVSAIALETVQAAMAAFAAHGITAAVCQIAVNETKTAGGLHLLLAGNPTFLLTGNCDD